jgi:hypothetical protein
MNLTQTNIRGCSITSRSVRGICELRSAQHRPTDEKDRLLKRGMANTIEELLMSANM